MRQLYETQGQLFRAVNATFNTAVAMNGASEQSFSETSASVIIENTGNTNKNIYPLWVRIFIAAAGTNGTNLSFVAQTDNILRYASGGSTLVPYNSVVSTGVKSDASVYFGAITANTASANANKLTGGAVVLNTSNPAANESYLFVFSDQMPLAQLPAAKTTILLNPIGLTPNSSFQLNLFSASQTVAPTAFVDIGWMER